jgi:hypothetical protein
MARFNKDEIERLDALRDLFAMSRAKYMRTRALDDPLPRTTIVPELNREAWVQLSRSASNLNQIAHHLNTYEINLETINIPVIEKLLKQFRNNLVGASPNLIAEAEEETDI